MYKLCDLHVEIMENFLKKTNKKQLTKTNKRSKIYTTKKDVKVWKTIN